MPDLANPGDRRDALAAALLQLIGSDAWQPLVDQATTAVEGTSSDRSAVAAMLADAITARNAAEATLPLLVAEISTLRSDLDGPTAPLARVMGFDGAGAHRTQLVGVPEDPDSLIALGSEVFSVPASASLPNPQYLTILPEVRRGRAYPQWFRQDGDGSDWSQAINRGMGELFGEAGGGVLMLDQQKYDCDDVVTVDAVGIGITGRGSGDQMSVPSVDAAAPTEIVAQHTHGPAVRVKQWSGGLSDFRITAGESRASLPHSPITAGLHYEASDTGEGLERVAWNYARNIRINRQPGEGLLVVGECVGLTLENIDTSGNKGAGRRFDRGKYTGRLHEAAPGIVTMNGGRSTRNGGHGIVLGNPLDADLPSFRFIINQAETFGNCFDPAQCYTADEAWISGDGHTIDTSAFSGMSVLGSPEDHRGLWIAGRGNTVKATRFIETTRPITYGVAPGRLSTSLLVLFPLVRNGSGFEHNPAIVVEPGAEGLIAIAGDASNIAALASLNVPNSIVIFKGREIQSRRVVRPSLLAGHHIAIPDASVYTFEFSDFQCGAMHINAIAASSCNAVINFYVALGGGMLQIASDPSNLVAVFTGAGVPTGSSGTSGKLNIFVDTSARKIWLVNRLGDPRAYRVSFSNTDPAGGFLLD